MCIQAIKSVGVKEYASELWTSIKEIDGGKILSSVSGLLEVNTKAIKKKLESLCDENTLSPSAISLTWSRTSASGR
jgi:hypothetical protein